MSETVLMGKGRDVVAIPREEWERGLAESAPFFEKHLSFMTKDHHRVRNFVVVQVMKLQEPLTPEFIARELGMTVDCVIPILDDLEKHLTFLFRNEQGAVVWAYPVTVEKTPHSIKLDTGEQFYAA